MQTAKILVMSPILGNKPHFYALDQYGEGYLTSDESNATLVSYEQYETAVAKENPTCSTWTWLGGYPSETPKAVTCFYWVHDGKFFYANDQAIAWNMGFGPYNDFHVMRKAAGRRRSRPGKNINFKIHDPAKPSPLETDINGQTAMTDKPSMYTHLEVDGFWTMRQERYRANLAAGREHPHDVCAIARSLEELRSMCEKHWPDADYSGDAE
jgi:hypothetical protein